MSRYRRPLALLAQCARACLRTLALRQMHGRRWLDAGPQEGAQ